MARTNVSVQTPAERLIELTKINKESFGNKLDEARELILLATNPRKKIPENVRLDALVHYKGGIGKGPEYGKLRSIGKIFACKILLKRAKEDRIEMGDGDRLDHLSWEREEYWGVFKNRWDLINKFEEFHRPKEKKETICMFPLGR